MSVGIPLSRYDEEANGILDCAVDVDAIHLRTIKLPP